MQFQRGFFKKTHKNGKEKQQRKIEQDKCLKG